MSPQLQREAETIVYKSLTSTTTPNAYKLAHILCESLCKNNPLGGLTLFLHHAEKTLGLELTKSQSDRVIGSDVITGDATWALVLLKGVNCGRISMNFSFSRFFFF